MVLSIQDCTAIFTSKQVNIPIDNIDGMFLDRMMITMSMDLLLILWKTSISVVARKSIMSLVSLQKEKKDSPRNFPFYRWDQCF